MKKMLFLGVLGLLAMGFAVTCFVRFVHQPLPLISTTIVELPQGSGLKPFALKLRDLRLVYHPFLVQLAARIYGYDRRLKAGEYELEPGMSLRDVFEKISQGKVILHRITLPEGLTTAQMLSILAENPLLQGTITEKVAEGELLPETYTFHKGAQRNAIVKNAKLAMTKAISEIWENRMSGLPLNTPQELLVLASVIEKETGVGDERGKVASVFVNRLNKGMLLQTDPTVIYALTLGKEDLGRNLTRADLKVDSPYNTYRYVGLPPAPICNPGLKALQAAAHPENTPYFYFVANGLGGHNFGRTLTEHNRHVQNWKKSRL